MKLRLSASMILSHRKHLLPLLAAWALSGAVQAQQVAPQDKDRAWLESKGTLLFEDDFEREETGNGLKDIGKGWESATADRAPHIKQADLDQAFSRSIATRRPRGTASTSITMRASQMAARPCASGSPV